MDDQLALRIQLFRETRQVSPEVALFVAAELDALAAEGLTVTEDTAGVLTSHLMAALTRLLDGAPIEAFRTDEQVAAELAGHPEAIARARAMALRAEKALGTPLPGSEVNFLGLHLAVLAENSPPTRHHTSERRSQS
ncbi:transcriptional antiterminator [Streptomyces sp. NPDC101062]|uniref:transcriptional antiterminator n=1 Tax=unclassified Streptomyces TaxID=2593676 RepID=UPI002E774539|nr:transcriptional antiterminator [Streptomyces sp. JV176]MEE1798791.1 transcriptional antiterminator [Streptomyces sp. JV176]